jgi:peroxiredoxin
MFIKRYIVLVLITFIITESFAQKEGYTIHGTLPGLSEGSKVVMLLMSGSKSTRTDSATVRNGEFFIKGIVPDGPRFYWLTFPEVERSCRLFIDNEEHLELKSTQDIKKINHGVIESWISIDGSKTHNAWSAINQKTDILFGAIRGTLMKTYMNNIKATVGFDPKTVGLLLELDSMFLKTYSGLFFLEPEDDVLPAIAVTSVFDFETINGHASIWSDAYSRLTDHYKNSYYGKILKEKIKLCVGQPFPQFTLPTVEGKLLSSKDVISKNKLTLVQFWASNSYNVDEFQNELKPLYNKYHEKGFNIIGVSSDSIEKKWKIGVVDLPWNNVSDLKGKSGIVENTYKEYGDHHVPNTTNVLIDQNGKIVAWDVFGSTLLQGYLYKYFDK